MVVAAVRVSTMVEIGPLALLQTPGASSRSLKLPKHIRLYDRCGCGVGTVQIR